MSEKPISLGEVTSRMDAQREANAKRWHSVNIAGGGMQIVNAQEVAISDALDEHEARAIVDAHNSTVE